MSSFELVVAVFLGTFLLNYFNMKKTSARFKSVEFWLGRRRGRLKKFYDEKKLLEKIVTQVAVVFTSNYDW